MPCSDINLETRTFSIRPILTARTPRPPRKASEWPLRHPATSGCGDMAGLYRWQGMWAQLGSPAPDDVLFHGLIARYSEPQRKYHFRKCFEKLQELRPDRTRPAEEKILLGPCGTGDADLNPRISAFSDPHYRFSWRPWRLGG